MKWFSRHPRLVLTLFFAADVFAIWRMVRIHAETAGPDLAQWIQLSVMCLIFGPLCLRFPDILGGIQGQVDGSWLNPTPGVVVTAIGWLFIATPLIVLMLLVL